MKEKTSFSQEINVNSFKEELTSSDRRGRPVETEEIQTRSSEDSKSLNVDQNPDREDRTHHWTPIEYFHYKSNWWLTFNKTSSNTVPMEQRLDFKQALSTLQQLKQNEEAQRNQRWAQSSSTRWSWQVSWCSLFLRKSPWRRTQY